MQNVRHIQYKQHHGNSWNYFITCSKIPDKNLGTVAATENGWCLLLYMSNFGCSWPSLQQILINTILIFLVFSNTLTKTGEYPRNAREIHYGNVNAFVLRIENDDFFIKGKFKCLTNLLQFIYNYVITQYGILK
jgi:hypothetical protein